jgi:hypothetical protein
MHPTTIIALFAATAMAAPASGWKNDTGGLKTTSNTTGNACGHNKKKACCNGMEGIAVVGAQCSLLDVCKYLPFSKSP